MHMTAHFFYIGDVLEYGILLQDFKHFMIFLTESRGIMYVSENI